jgi:hypothetical protein
VNPTILRTAVFLVLLTVLVWWCEATRPVPNIEPDISSREPTPTSAPNRRGSDGRPPTVPVRAKVRSREEAESPTEPEPIAGAVMNRTIFGRILTTDGEGVANAEVLLRTALGTETECTADGGRYVHRVVWRPGSSPPSIVAYARGFRPTTVNLYPYRQVLRSDGDSVQNAVEHDIVIKPGATIIGRIMAGSRIVKKARILLVPEEPDVPGPILTWTDSAGRFVAAAMVRRSYKLLANHARFGSASLDFVRDHQGVADVGDIQLLRRGLLSGRILFPDGTCVPNLSVAVVNTVVKHQSEFGARFGMTQTGRLGYFRFYGLAPGQYRVEIPALRFRVEPPILKTETEPIDITVLAHRIRIEVQDPAGTMRPDAEIKWTEVVTAGGAERATKALPYHGVPRPRMDHLVRVGSTWKLQCSTTETMRDSHRVQRHATKLVRTTEDDNETVVRIVLR